MNCLICKNTTCLPIKLPCEHIFCYVCAINNFKNNKCYECKKECKEEIGHYVMNYDINSNIVWLYSAQYNNKWWCYDERTSNMIESAYNDYLKRAQFKIPDKKQQSILGINSNLIIQLDSSQSNNASTNVDNTVNTVNIDDNAPRLFAPIDFSNEDIVEHSNNKTNDRISYEFIIGSDQFLMNFNDMFQINQKTNTKRQIQRIALDEKISIDKKWECLRDKHNVKGIAGIIFRSK